MRHVAYQLMARTPFHHLKISDRKITENQISPTVTPPYLTKVLVG